MLYVLLWFLSVSFASLAWCIVVVWLCIVLYRLLRLPALPWLACRYTLEFFAWLLSSYAMSRLFAVGSSATPPAGQILPSTWVFLVRTLFWTVGDLLVAVLAFSEVAFLVRRAFPDVESKILSFLLRARTHIPALGIAACICTVSVPIMYFVILWLHGPFAPNTY